MTKRPFSADTVRVLLENQRVATLEDLKDALGTTGTMTVFRKLKALGYLSSYSHRGKYYALREIPDFDARSLCRHDTLPAWNYTLYPWPLSEM